MEEMTCRCGHTEEVHAWGRNRDRQRVRMDCTAQDGFKFCKCPGFQEAKSEQEIIMEKEKAARVKKPQSEGRKPRLAGLLDSPLVIFMTTGGKEYKGTVLTSGMIKVDEKEFTSPSSAGSYILGNDKKGKPRQVDGWKSWTFNKDGKRVSLDTLRGAKSPLKAEPAKPKAARKAKVAKPASAKAPRKPRAAKTTKKPNGAASADVADSDIPQNEEATA
jgi:hypothetical protein